MTATGTGEGSETVDEKEPAEERQRRWEPVMEVIEVVVLGDTAPTFAAQELRRQLRHLHSLAASARRQ